MDFIATPTQGTSRRRFLKNSAFAAICGPTLLTGMMSNIACAQNAPAGANMKKRPNIIFILADDLGYADLGCYGSTKIKTPNLDRLAREGMKFNQCYAGNPVCGPSRECLLKGVHAGHARLRRNIDSFSMPDGDILVSEVLKTAGYKTAIIGKWGMGLPDSAAGMPLKQGFDEFFGYITHLEAHHPYPNQLFRNDAQPINYPNNRQERKVYANDEFTRESKEFVSRHKDEPFFLYLSYTIPHASLEVPPESLAQYAGEGWPEKPFAPAHYAGQPTPHAAYAAMVSHMDAQIGQLMAHLKELKLDENTIVFFTSDNGPHQEGGGDPEFFDSNGPMRGIKRDLFEGGIRVPMIAHWTGTIKPAESEHVWYFPDFLATAAELAGATQVPPTDGISTVPALLGKPQKAHEYLYWEFVEGGFKQAVRMGDWKAVRIGANKETAFTKTPQLYNLKTDIGETKNVAAENSEVAARIAEIMRTARVDVEQLDAKA